MASGGLNFQFRLSGGVLPDFLPRIVQWHVKMLFFDVLYPQVVPTGLGFFVIHNFFINLMAKSSRSTLTSPGGI
jgi:hypothetical protein